MNIGFILVSVPVILTLLAFIYVAYVAGKFAHSKPTQRRKQKIKSIKIKFDFFSF